MNEKKRPGPSDHLIIVLLVGVILLLAIYGIFHRSTVTEREQITHEKTVIITQVPSPPGRPLTSPKNGSNGPVIVIPAPSVGHRATNTPGPVPSARPTVPIAPGPSQPPPIVIPSPTQTEPIINTCRVITILPCITLG